MTFELPKLGYAYDALAPYIDAKTMEIHHSKHHQGYTNNLNKSTAGTDLEGKEIMPLLKTLDMNNAAVRNNAGGFFNHSLFWEILQPGGSQKPTTDLSEKITQKFGSYEAFKGIFSNAAATQFGSGWAWLCIQKNGDLEVCATPNQDNPLMPNIGCGGFPILGLDVWEHAYYLNYQNRRPDYIKAFFEIINWDVVAENIARWKEMGFVAN